jgi:hypothetical protein
VRGIFRWRQARRLSYVAGRATQEIWTAWFRFRHGAPGRNQIVLVVVLVLVIEKRKIENEDEEEKTCAGEQNFAGYGGSS